MRLRYLIPPALLLVCAATGAAITAHAAADRQHTFTAAAGQLRGEWDQEQAQGVPAASLAGLRTELSSKQPAAAWWSPEWLSNDGHALLDGLRARGHAAWTAALAEQRSQAQALITQWTGFAGQQGTWLTGDATSAASQWPAQLAAASSPAAIQHLMSSWQAFLSQQQTAVVAAQQAKLEAELQSAGGPQAVLAAARRLSGIAASANLDAGDVAALADRLSAQIAARADATATGELLLTSVNALQSLVNLNNSIAGQVRPLFLTVNQALAEATPQAGALSTQYQAIAGQFRAARTGPQLTAVSQTVQALQGAVNAELAANQCGHAVGAGKVITLSLSLQEMVFYQDGCAVQATPTTSGRPQLRTPTGTFHIFYKMSPFTFISPWPKSSPYYYYPSVAQYVMEFAGGGYFIHDAPWESIGAYGPGSQDNLAAASHGCVHVPSAVMQWAYSWTPNGTTVVIRD